MAGEDSTTETWKPVIEFEDLYSVSNLGRVRRDGIGVNTYTGRLLKPGLSVWGYPQVGLTKHGNAYTRMVHRLVTTAFLGPRPEGLQVNHIDGCKTNNHISNLEYVTPKENSAHAVRLGLYRTGKNHPRSIDSSSVVGERNPKAKLNQFQVRVIRRLIPLLSRGQISRLFKVDVHTVYDIQRNRTWRHLLNNPEGFAEYS